MDNRRYHRIFAVVLLFENLMITRDGIPKLFGRLKRVRLYFVCPSWLRFSGSLGPPADVTIWVLWVVTKNIVLRARWPLPKFFA